MRHLCSVYDKKGKLIATSYKTTTLGHVEFYDFRNGGNKQVSIEHFESAYVVKKLTEKACTKVRGEYE